MTKLLNAGRLAAAGVLVLLLNSHASANLLKNASFETDPIGLGLTALSGWSVLAGTIDIVPLPGDTFLAKDGAKYLETVGTPGYATVTQAFASIPGQQYAFTGWLAHHPGIGTETAIANVFFNDVYSGSLTHGGTFDEWRPFRQVFTATLSTTELKIQDVTHIYEYGGLFLDGLSISAVPEPSSFILAALGLIGLAAWGWRRKLWTASAESEGALQGSRGR